MRRGPVFTALVQRQPRSIWTPPAVNWEAALVLADTSGTHDYIGRAIRYTGADSNYGCIRNNGAGAAHRFINCLFWTNTHIVKSWAASGFEFYNCFAICENPNVDGVAHGCLLEGPASYLIAENNSATKLGGFRLNTANLSYMRVRYNKFLNIFGSKSNGAGGYRVQSSYGDTSAYVRNSMLQLNGVTAGAGGAGAGTGGTSRSEIAWNYVFNEPYESCATDIVSLINGGGVSGGRLWTHHNYFDGMYSQVPFSIGNEGRGIQHELPTVGGTGGGYHDAEDNVFVRMPGAIEIYEGNSEVSIRRNRQYCSVNYDPSHAPYPYHAANQPGINQVWEDNEWHTYTMGYQAVGGANPFIENSGNSGNGVGTGWVEHSPACTAADENAQEPLWWAAVSAAGHSIGSTLSI